MGEWMTGVEEPLGVMQAGAKELAMTSTDKHDAFEAKVHALERVRHQQKILHFFLDMERKVAWLENAAGIERPTGGGGKTPRRQDSHPSTGTAITDLAKLEHVVLLLALAIAAVQHGSKHFPFIAALDVRVRAVTAVCQTSARSLLMPLLRDHDHDRLAACARVYLHLNAWSQLVVLVVTAAVDPLLTRRTDVPLPTVLDELWTRLESGPVALAKILAPHVPRDQALILSTHILLRVLEYLSGTPSIFSPAVPSTFHRNYTATTTLLRRLVTDLGLAHVADAIPELAAFLRKWPVEVYFQMLARQAISGRGADHHLGDAAGHHAPLARRARPGRRAPVLQTCVPVGLAVPRGRGRAEWGRDDNDGDPGAHGSGRIARDGDGVGGNAVARDVPVGECSRGVSRDV
ncbi:hypothetical protein, variant [Allomyces macrogynus ATCC 38327]|nr:hypothetical protein, variant [Allomyces macrogynus ATCC 38327]|eukprot:KNE57234.1 hypothetical protein, variant [Allomyces macrogynus ATCC 38327]